MDPLFGFKGNSYTIIVTDSALTNSVVKINCNHLKQVSIDNKVSIGYSGEIGDAQRMVSYASEKMKFEYLYTNIDVEAKVVANIVQGAVHKSIRKDHKKVSCMIGDWSELYCVDVYGAMWKTEFAGMGYATYFLYGIFDKQWRPGMSLEDGIKLIEMCGKVLKEKFVLGTCKYDFSIVTKDGVEMRELVV